MFVVKHLSGAKLYVKVLITVIISFMIQAPGTNAIKLFTAVSYAFS